MAAKKKKATKKSATKPAKKAAKKPAAKPAKKAAKRAKPAAAKRAAAAPAAPKFNGPAMVHWEIQSQDAARLHEFYSQVFGWKIDANNSMNYGMVESKGGNGINGGIGGSMSPGARTVVYTEVEAIDPVLETINGLGGATVMPRTDIGPVIMAVYTDPEGNTMGLIESR